MREGAHEKKKVDLHHLSRRQRKRPAVNESAGAQEEEGPRHERPAMPAGKEPSVDGIGVQGHENERRYEPEDEKEYSGEGINELPDPGAGGEEGGESQSSCEKQ